MEHKQCGEHHFCLRDVLNSQQLHDKNSSSNLQSALNDTKISMHLPKHITLVVENIQGRGNTADVLGTVFVLDTSLIYVMSNKTNIYSLFQSINHRNYNIKHNTNSGIVISYQILVI